MVTAVDSGVTQDGEPVMVEFTAAVELTSPLRLDQFAAELATQVGLDSTVLVLSSNGDTAMASTDAPVVLWTTNQEISADALLAAATAHTPDPTWTAGGHPGGGVTMDDLREKVRTGAALSVDEMQLAVRYLLLDTGTP